MEDSKIHVAADKLLLEKIRNLEGQIEFLREQLDQSRTKEIERVIGRLRLRELLFLYVGDDVEKLAKDLEKEFGETAAQIFRHMFMLDNVCITEEQRDAVKVALNHGLACF